MQALTKQVTDTVSLQAEIEAQQATIDSLQEELAQLAQLHASKEELVGTLQEGNGRLREQLELEQALRRQADKASEVRRTASLDSKSSHHFHLPSCGCKLSSAAQAAQHVGHGVAMHAR